MKSLALIGTILGIFGGILLFLNISKPLVTIEDLLMNLDALGGYTLSDANAEVFYISLAFQVAVSVAAIIFSILGFIFNMKSSKLGRIFYAIVLLVGLIAFLGIFFELKPEEVIDFGGPTATVPAAFLSYAAFYFDGIFATVGGLLGSIAKIK